MADIQVTTNQSVIEVTQNNGITVTTPEGQTIAVTVPNSSVEVTTTTDNITVLTNGTLNITTTDTDRLVAGSNQVILNTDATMTFPNNVIDFGNQTADLKSSVWSELWYRNANPSPTAGQGIQTYVWSWENQAGIAVESVDNGYKEWFFNANGTTQFPGYTFPYADGTNNQILKTNGAGVLAWYSPSDLNTTYTIDASTVSGGANFNLVGSDSTTDSIKIASGTNITVSRTDANTITIDGSDLNTTYAISSAATSGGANLNLVGSDSTTDSVSYLGSGATTVTSTDTNTITIASTDTNTTYTQNISSTTGGANLNLVGSDSTTDTVKFADGTGVTVSYTDANTATIAIGQSVATSATPTFAGVISTKGLQSARTVTGGGKVVDANGDVLVNNSTINTTQLPVSAMFDNTTANRNGRIVVREYGQNTGSAATSSTIGTATITLEASRGTGAVPTSVNVANTSIGAVTTGYHDGTRFTSESGIGAPVGFFLQNSEATASETSVFTASISTAVVAGQAAGTGTLTVTAVSGSSNIHVGQLLTGTGVAVGTVIIAYGNNTFGGTGTYAVNFGQTTSSTTITGVGTTAGGGRIVQLITPSGNKISTASRQTMYVTSQTAPTTSTVNTVSVPVNAVLNIINGNLEAADATYVNSAGTVVYKARGGGTFQIPTLNFQMFGVTSSDTCSFTGYIDNGAGAAGNTLTVTAVASGVLYVGQKINATALSTTTPYFISALGTGTGLTGTYTVASTFQTAGTTVGSSASPVAMVGGPDDYGLLGKGNIIDSSTYRKSTVSLRRAPLKNSDEIFAIKSNAQVAAVGTNTTRNNGTLKFTATEDYTTSASGNKFDVVTTTAGTNTTTTSLSVDSNTVTTNGDLRINGNDIQGSDGNTNISLTSNTLTTFAGDVRINGNDIQGSGGSTAITLTSANTLTTVVGDTFKVNSAGGINYFQTFNDGSGHIVASINQTRATTGNEFATVNFTTQRSADGINFTPTLNNDVIGSFKFNGNANTSTSPGVPAGPGAQIYATATENWTSLVNGTKINFNVIKKGAITDVDVISAASDATTFKSDAFTLESSAGTDYLVMNGTSNTFYQPVGFPVYTVAAAGAITGAVGQQIAISNSSTSPSQSDDGMMAYWATNGTPQWRYIHNNGAL